MKVFYAYLIRVIFCRRMEVPLILISHLWYRSFSALKNHELLWRSCLINVLIHLVIEFIGNDRIFVDLMSFRFYRLAYCGFFAISPVWFTCIVFWILFCASKYNFILRTCLKKKFQEAFGKVVICFFFFFNFFLFVNSKVLFRRVLELYIVKRTYYQVSFFSFRDPLSIDWFWCILYFVTCFLDATPHLYKRFYLPFRRYVPCYFRSTIMAVFRVNCHQMTS